MTRTLIVIGGLVATFGVGLTAGRTLAPGKSTGRTVRSAPLKSALTHASRTGAIAAASTILYSSFDLCTVLDPSRFEATVHRVAAPGTEDRVRRLFGRGIDDVRAVFADSPRVSRATPVGYRLLKFDGTRASVAIWNVAIGGSSLMTPVAQWRTIVLDLRFTAQGWKATDGRSMSGPSPAATTSELATRAGAFNSFRHAP